MSQYQMLGEFVYHCTKCKLDLNHRITLMNGDLPKRILCLTCYTERSYYAPGHGGKKEPVSTRSLSSHDMARVRQTREEDEWKLKLADKGKTPVTYSINAELEPDEHVFHPTFGLGVVIGFVGGDKVQIYFGDEGVKLLKGKTKPHETKPSLKSVLLR